jgi:hypothetical protein
VRAAVDSGMRVALVSLLLAGSIGGVAGVAPARAQDQPAEGGEGGPGAVKILLTMKRVYASCRSYRDTGEVKTESRIEGGEFGGEQPFSTSFVRPGPFRFEFTDRGLGERSSVYIVWSDGAEVRSWWDAQPGVRRPTSLQEALDVASGISGGSSLRVPGMLLPGTVGSGPPLIDPERIADAVDGGSACYRIRGRDRVTPYTFTAGAMTVTVKDETVTFWIDRGSYLLRKVEDARTLDTYTSLITTTYEPEIDVDVPAGQLAFAPPQGR